MPVFRMCVLEGKTACLGTPEGPVSGRPPGLSPLSTSSVSSLSHEGLCQVLLRQLWVPSPGSLLIRGLTYP